MRPAVVTIALLMIASGVGALFGMQQPRVEPATLSIPRATTPIAIDGELDEPTWTTGNPARTGAFPPGKPYSDARMLFDDATLYVALYAADEDIETRTTEHDGPLCDFDVNGTEYRIEVSPKCVVTDGRGGKGGKMDFAWNSGARVACDTDGTINEPKDMDEEWVVEMALPLASIGIERHASFGLTIERCDTPKNERRSCTSWSRRAVLE
jgi:hypothetical protein